MTSRLLRQLGCWIALVAIVAVTFMPAFMQRVAYDIDRADVCSAESPRGAGSGEPAHHPLEHCPYCALHADLALLPNPPIDDGGRALAFSAFPAAFLQAPRANHAWSASQPRAPPHRV